MITRYPGIPSVIHGNGAVAEVMGHVCGGVIGYPITPSTEISEIYEAFRSSGGRNVWGKHPFFFEPEGDIEVVDRLGAEVARERRLRRDFLFVHPQGLDQRLTNLGKDLFRAKCHALSLPSAT